MPLDAHLDATRVIAGYERCWRLTRLSLVSRWKTAGNDSGPERRRMTRTRRKTTNDAWPFAVLTTRRGPIRHSFALSPVVGFGNYRCVACSALLIVAVSFFVFISSFEVRLVLFFHARARGSQSAVATYGLAIQQTSPKLIVLWTTNAG